MRSGQGSQSLCSIWVTVVLLIGATVVLPGAALSVAQENSGQVGYCTESFPAGSALAKIEADGHSPSEARQLLLDRLPKGQDGSSDENSTEIVSSAQLLNDQLHVHGSREYINLVKQQLINVQKFGLQQLLYTILVVEVPTEEAKAIVEKWKLAGKSTSSVTLQNNAVVPASFAASATQFEFRISDALSDEQINELSGLGKVISSPKIVGQNGAEVNVQVGREVQFVATYEPVKDENDNDSTTMQPKVLNLHDGIKLDLTGVLDSLKENVQLVFNLKHSQLKGMETFTFESKHGPLTVQQPNLRSTAIQTTCHVPVNKTMAICSGPIIRETVVEQSVPLMGRIPYVGKLFKNTAMATESISTIILIRCQEHEPASP